MLVVQPATIEPLVELGDGTWLGLGLGSRSGSGLGLGLPLGLGLGLGVGLGVEAGFGLPFLAMVSESRMLLLVYQVEPK